MNCLLLACPAGARRRLSAGLDPVRTAAHQGGRPRRHPHHRLGQHRRDQRAAHRQQGARRRDAAARCAEGHRRPCCSPRSGAVRHRHRRRRWPSRPASAPSSATSIRSGSASRAARASPPTSACCSGCTGRRRCVLRGVAASGCHPLFLAVRAGRQHRHAGRRVGPRLAGGRDRCWSRSPRCWSTSTSRTSSG